MTLQARLVSLFTQLGNDSELLFKRSMPIGGAAGQVLAKLSNADYDLGWIEEGVTSGTSIELVEKNPVFTYDIQGRLTLIVYESLNSKQFFYNSLGLLERVDYKTYALGNRFWSPTLSYPSCIIENKTTVWVEEFLAVSAFTMTTGKHYCEFKPTNGNYSYLTMIGIVDASIGVNNNIIGSTAAGGHAYYAYDGSIYEGDVSYPYGATYNRGDVIGMAFDADAKTIQYFKNGVSQGLSPRTITGSSFRVAASSGTIDYTTIDANFGDYTFKYSPPADYSAPGNPLYPIINRSTFTYDVNNALTTIAHTRLLAP